MNRRDYVLGFVTEIIGDKVKAEMVLERLESEGLLHLGYGDAEIDNIISTFAEVFGTTKTTKQDRWAASRLAKKYGGQAVVGIIKLLGQSGTEKYAPVVNSVADLETKWVSVLNFVRNISGNQEVDV